MSWRGIFVIHELNSEGFSSMEIANMLIRDRPWIVAVFVASIFCGAKSPPIMLAKRLAELPPLSAPVRKMAHELFQQRKFGICV